MQSNDIKTFFQEYPENSSPAAIVIGFRTPTAVSCLDMSDDELDLSSVAPGTTVPGKIEISYLEAALLEDKEKRELLRGLLAQEIHETREHLSGSLIEPGVVDVDASDQNGDAAAADLDEGNRDTG